MFSDKSLRSIARNRPTDEAALLRCHGVGERKLEQYGELFLSLMPTTSTEAAVRSRDSVSRRYDSRSTG